MQEWVICLPTKNKETEVCQCFRCHAGGQWIIMRFKVHAAPALLHCVVELARGFWAGQRTLALAVIMSTTNSNRWQMVIMQDYNAEHQIIWSSIDDAALSVVGSSLLDSLREKIQLLGRILVVDFCVQRTAFSRRWGADTRMGTDVPRSVPLASTWHLWPRPKATKMSHS